MIIKNIMFNIVMLKHKLRTVTTFFKTLTTFKTEYETGLSYIIHRTIHTTYCSCSRNATFNIVVNGIVLDNYVEKIEQEYKFENLNNTRKNKLEPVINLLGIRNELVNNLANLNELLNEKDETLKKLAEEEKETYKEQIDNIDGKLFEKLLSVDCPEEDYDSIVLEVNAGVGGQEAMLFAKELFDMYNNFSEYKGWNFQIAEYATTELGGIRFGSALINGSSVFKYFKHEAGVHRVQRIPATEKSGRIHTSTVAVVAMPQPNDIQIKIESKDLKIETKRSSGAGGQHVNTTDSAVRIVHIPTGLAVDCQVDRSQIKNKQIALIKLRTLLYQKELDEQILKAESTRKSQVRTNFRNEKIRTYNFSQDRITDHRLQGENVHNLKAFMLGGLPLEELIDRLHNKTKIDYLLNIVNSLNNK